MKAKVNFFIDKYHPRKDNTCTVKVEVYYNGKRKHYPTHISLTPEDFEKVFNNSRRTSEQREIKAQLKAYKKKAKKIIKKMKVFTYPAFEEKYFSHRKAERDVSLAFEQRIKELRLNDQVGTMITYECAKNSLEVFKKGLSFADITPQLLKRYEKQLLKEGKSITTVSIYLRCLRALYHRQNIDRSLYPFGKGKYTIPTARNIKKALTLKEIALIYNYETEPLTYEDRAKDYWLFLYLCNGMNVKDFCLLKWKNIKDNILTYERAKTKTTQTVKESITVALKPEALEVIKKWGQPAIDKEAYIFPHLSKEMTAERERAVYQQVTKNTNKHIKRIAKAVGIQQKVTTYSARHSFATVLKRSGANIAMISDLLGHSSLATTQNYLAGFELEQIQQQTDVLTKGFHTKAN